jgi:pimeloyl-ACP methyl ester carboxylesterase
VVKVRRPKKMYVVIDNLRIRYLDNASVGKKTLVFLHGLGGSIESWDKNLGYLSKKYRVVAFDLPGFGLSDKPRRNYTLGFFSSFVLRAIRELKIGIPVDLIGSSLGGQIAARIAFTSPGRVAKLVLISPAGFTPKSFLSSNGLQKYIRILDARSSAEIKKALSGTTTTQVRCNDAQMVYKRISMPGAKNAFASALKYSTTARRININRLKSPTFVIWGKEDRIIPVRFILPFIEMKNCRLCILENCGHRPHTEKPKVTNEIIERFIEEN